MSNQRPSRTGRRPERAVPFAYDDGVRGGIPLTIGVAGFVALTFIQPPAGISHRVMIAAAGCLTVIIALTIYLVWTHVLFTKTPPDTLTRIGAAQARRGPSSTARALGVGSTASWAVSVAIAALAGAIAAALLGTQDGGILLIFLALLTALVAWCTVVYSFALRYFRLHSGGETFGFEIAKEPVFSDFITLSMMISAAGALSAATPTTRAAMNAVRSHTVIAFVFNALVIAMAVSLLSGFVAAMGTG